MVAESSVDARRLVALTPSKIREYRTCPQQYKLRHLSRRSAPAPVSAALSFGNSLHAALEAIHNLPPDCDNYLDLTTLLRRHWRDNGYADAREADSHFARGLSALRDYTAAKQHLSGETLGVELYLSRVLRVHGVRARLGCKVDRLALHTDGALEAVDYKTYSSGQVPTGESLLGDLPTFLYYALVRVSYPERRRVIVSQLNVLTLRKVEIAYEEQDVTAHKHELARTIREIEAGMFPPRQSEACAWCSVNDRCPAFAAEVDADDLV